MRRLLFLVTALGEDRGLLDCDREKRSDPSAGAESSDRREKDCSDFGSQAQAQRYFENNGGSSSNNVDELDADGDGVACESNPCPCSTGGGDGGGGDGGGVGGGSPPPEPKVTTKKLCGKFRGIPNSRICLRAKLRGDKLKKVKSFRFRRLPARCDNGTTRSLVGNDRGIRGKGKRFKSRDGSIRGPFTGQRVLIAGKVSGGGKKARGIVRVRFRGPGGTAWTRGRGDGR